LVVMVPLMCVKSHMDLGKPIWVLELVNSRLPQREITPSAVQFPWNKWVIGRNKNGMGIMGNLTQGNLLD
jgi:hypothetical protein